MKNFFDSIDFSQVLKYSSLIVNLIILFKWLFSKIVLNRFLLGRWEGNIIDSQRSLKLNCILIVTGRPERLNKGFFYYEQVQAQSILVRGVDELDDYEDDFAFIYNRRWKATFFREFHVAYNEKMQGEQIDASETVKYNWNCTIHNIMFKPKIKVNISGNGMEFDGVLHKS